ncbi:MAG: glycosyltransferase [Bacteroidales bacterium]|nr:glycosyltransferase [Bacteroidales bacterium]
MAKFSIIIPTFNSKLTIRRCVDSVIGQSYEDFELLLMDGASQDDTVAIVRSYNDKRIRVFSEPDKGIYDAMNKGIDKSSGNWLLFLGSDDYLYDRDVLSNVVPFLLDELDVVYGEVESHWPELNRGEWSLEKIDGNRCHQAIFYNRRFFGKTIRYNLRYPVLADFDLNLKWFLNRKYKHCYIPITISHFSDGGMSSQVQDVNFYKDVGLNKLKYNNHVLTPLYKKRAARQYVMANPEKKILNTVLSVYANYLAVVQKVCSKNNCRCY